MMKLKNKTNIFIEVFATGAMMNLMLGWANEYVAQPRGIRNPNMAMSKIRAEKEKEYRDDIDTKDGEKKIFKLLFSCYMGPKLVEKRMV